MSTSLLHPPSVRDLDVYESVCIARYSLRAAAEKHHLSVARIRQLVSRVASWIAHTLPPVSEFDGQKQLQLARNIAADQIRYAQSELMDLWRQTQNASFLVKTTRLTLAAARLGVVSGTIDGLVADAWEAAGIDIDADNIDEQLAALPRRPASQPPPPHVLPTPEPDTLGAGLPAPPSKTDRSPPSHNPQIAIPSPPPGDCAPSTIETPVSAVASPLSSSSNPHPRQDLAPLPRKPAALAVASQEPLRAPSHSPPVQHHDQTHYAVVPTSIPTPSP